MSYQQNDLFARPSDSWVIPWVSCVLAKNSFPKYFSKWIDVHIRHCKKFHIPLRKTNLYYQTVIDQRVTALHQLFRWTSVGHSKYINDDNEDENYNYNNDGNNDGNHLNDNNGDDRIRNMIMVMIIRQ